MVRVTEVKGVPCVFTLTDGSTLRVMPYKSKDIKDSLVSEEILIAVQRGYVRTNNIKGGKTPEIKSGGDK